MLRVCQRRPCVTHQQTLASILILVRIYICQALLVGIVPVHKRIILNFVIS